MRRGSSGLKTSTAEPDVAVCLAAARARVDAVLEAWGAGAGALWPAPVAAAMRYSLLSAGKRLRPALVFAAYEAAGGTVAVLLPGGPGPLTVGDRWRWGRLLLALRQTRLCYPNDRALRRLDEAVERHGLHVVSDDERRFAHACTGPDDADRFIESLYLPGVSAARVRAGRRVAAAWVGGEIGIPLRRVVVRATP